MEPLVTVVVPAYNAGAFLRATIESVQAQTHKNWEMILSDDGSTDNTVALAREMAASDPRITVLTLEPARNPAIRRNDGFAQGRGEYFALLDADDIWLPDKIERQITAMHEVESPGLCYGLTEEFSDDPNVALRGWPKFTPPIGRKEQYERSLLTYNWAAPSTIMVSREFLNEIGVMPTEALLAKNDTQDLVLRALHRRPFVFVPQVLARYRVSSQSLSVRPDPIPMWRRYLEVRRRADARGELSAELRRRAYSVCWQRRAEEEMKTGVGSWRRSFLMALIWNPTNPRRWGNILSVFLPRAWMGSLQESMRLAKQRLLRP